MTHDEVETAIRNATGLFRGTVVEHALYRAAYVAGMRAAAEMLRSTHDDGVHAQHIDTAADRIEQEQS